MKLNKTLLCVAALLAMSAGTANAATNRYTAGFAVNNLVMTSTDNILLDHGAYGYVATTASGTVYGYVSHACDGNGWDLNGIKPTDISSGIVGVGAMTGDYALNTLGYSTFHGQTVTSASTLLLSTYLGDADLNGVVNADDYFYIDDTVNQMSTGGSPTITWATGDFDYNGVINADDYFWIDNTVNTLGSTGVAASAVAVPEPSTVVLLGGAACGLLLGFRKKVR